MLLSFFTVAGGAANSMYDQNKYMNLRRVNKTLPRKIIVAMPFPGGIFAIKSDSEHYDILRNNIRRKWC
jgi:hypothetical protein